MPDRKKGPRDEKHDKVGYRRQTQIHENLEEPAEEAPERIDKAVRFEEPEDPEAERKDGADFRHSFDEVHPARVR